MEFDSKLERNKFVLAKHEEGLSYREIADLAGINKETVSNILKTSGTSPANDTIQQIPKLTEESAINFLKNLGYECVKASELKTNPQVKAQDLPEFILRMKDWNFIGEKYAAQILNAVFDVMPDKFTEEQFKSETSGFKLTNEMIDGFLDTRCGNRCVLNDGTFKKI